MQSYFSNLNALFPILIGVAITWILLGIAASIIYRKLKGKPIFPRRPLNASFCETSASGHSNRSQLTRLSGARRCLMVAVTKDSLLVQPTFPFNLLFLPEIFGLELNVDKVGVRIVEEKKVMFGKAVVLEYVTADQLTQSIELHLRGMDQFLKALSAR